MSARRGESAGKALLRDIGSYGGCPRVVRAKSISAASKTLMSWALKYHVTGTLPLAGRLSVSRAHETGMSVVGLGLSKYSLSCMFGLRPDCSNSAVAHTGTQAKPTDRRLRILIADDHPVIRKRVRSILEEHPRFEVCGEAVDGANAIEIAQRLKPDVIVLNVTMPGRVDWKRDARSRRSCRNRRSSYCLPVQMSVLSRRPGKLVLGHTLRSPKQGKR